MDNNRDRLMGDLKFIKTKNTIAAGSRHSVGLKSDGTAVSVGDNEYGQCDVSDWGGIQLPGK
jgi:alpha-tubulin suppressor-like RCC1 family protein